MLLKIPDVLDAADLERCRVALAQAPWTDGNVTSGPLAARAKRNEQLPEESAVSRELGELVLARLARSPLFISAALPLKTYPPLFNRYREGDGFRSHVDNAVRMIRGTPHRVRTDLSATLFLSNPADYDGGELAVEDTYGVHQVKLPAGSLVLYPASSLHHVTPVTRGVRTASFFWVQSMVRDDGQRTLLFDMDQAIQRLGRDVPDHPSLITLTGSYHNLLRRWADA